MNIYSTTPFTNFKPTWLYIKQHNVTGLKYFGKTSLNDPYTYSGSGLYWKRHLAIHGNDVTTVWCQLFENKEELISFAVTFSEENNIVSSKEWANLKLENGLDGNIKGTKASESTKINISKGRTGKGTSPKTAEHKKKISSSNIGKNKGRKLTSEHIQKCRRPGKLNGRAKQWIFTSPTNEIFYVHGNFRSFCVEHNLEYTGMQTIAKTQKPASKGKNLGWFIIQQDEEIPVSKFGQLHNL